VAYQEERQLWNTRDYPQELREWITETSHDWIRYLKYEVVKGRLSEWLSKQLAKRKKLPGEGLSLVLYEIEHCGRSGECQVHKKTGQKRHIGHYCNNRQFHLACAMRYRNGQGKEMRNQYLEIAKANKLWGFYDPTFTLPEEARKVIDDYGEEAKRIILDCRKAVADTMREALGLNMKARGKQPGFHVVYHPSSSRDPYKQSAHFHVIGLPLLADRKTGELTKLPKRLDHEEVKRIYKAHLDRVFIRHGIFQCIKPAYTVHLHYLERRERRKLDHVFKYTNRSQVEDVLNTIKKVPDDFEENGGEFACVLKEDNVYRPAWKTEDQILDALEFILNPLIQVRMAYGFMRVLDRYSQVLGVERDEWEDDKNWRKLYDIEIRRETNNVYDLDLHKVVTKERIFIREKHAHDPWEEISPADLRGEVSLMQDRKLYKAIR
jgi:hypothetical protein